MNKLTLSLDNISTHTSVFTLFPQTCPRIQLSQKFYKEANLEISYEFLNNGVKNCKKKKKKKYIYIYIYMAELIISNEELPLTRHL